MDVYLLKVVSHPNMTEPGFLDTINSWEMNCIHTSCKNIFPFNFEFSKNLLQPMYIYIVHDFIDNISNLPFSFVVIYGWNYKQYLSIVRKMSWIMPRFLWAARFYISYLLLLEILIFPNFLPLRRRVVRSF